MDEKCSLRSSDNLFELGEIKFIKQEKIDLSKTFQLPTYKYVVERYFTEIGKRAKTEIGKKDSVIHDLSVELTDIWIFANIPPMTMRAVRILLEKDIKLIDKLKRTAKSKRLDKWNEQVSVVAKKAMCGYNIKSDDTEVIQKMVKEYGVEYGEEEILLYEDNCGKVDEGQWSAGLRLRWCGGTDIGWWREAKKRMERLKKSDILLQKREQKIEEERKKLNEMSQLPDEKGSEYEKDEPEFMQQDTDEDEFEPAKTELKSPTAILSTPKIKRSTRSTPDSTPIPEIGKIPKMEVRTGYKTIKPSIMECLVVMESKFKVEGRKCCQLLAYIANTVFGQSWEVEKIEDSDDHTETPVKKSRMAESRHLNFTLPSRTAIRNMVKDFSLISYQDMASTIASAQSDGKVVNYGVDDTIKAAGKKRLDVKTAHITIIDSEKKRESFTSGFFENTSHKGKVAAETVQYDIAKMAVLTENTYKDMFSMIDFFMNDRAGDGETMLDALGVEDRKRLKCNAHIILVSDVSIDKVFRDIEVQIGLSKLIESGAAHVFSNSSKSIWYLGLIAIAKLVSPSHNKESISLYTDYIEFLKVNVKESNEYAEQSSALLKLQFKGFISNRFGRLGELSSLFLQHKAMLLVFFDKQINVNANKLVLAVSCYLSSSWFSICCEIANDVYETVTVPIKKAIGIDGFKGNSERTWTSVKSDLENILESLQSPLLSVSQAQKDKLKAKCMSSVKEGIERQLQVMPFFHAGFEENEEYTQKRRQSVLTNLGAESEFATLDNDIRKLGGSTSLQTISDKHVIARNKLYLKDRWIELSEKEKSAKWKWARNSEQAKAVKKLENEFLDKIKAVKKDATLAKERQKQKETQLMYKALEDCKLHGGPVTRDSLSTLSDLTHDEIIKEVTFLKRSTCPSIRFKRKVGNKFVKFSDMELVAQIKDAISPECKVVDVNALLDAVLRTNELELVDHDKIDSVQHCEVGTVAWWNGPLDEVKLGVLITCDVIQLYKKSRYGFEPSSSSVNYSDWRLNEVIDEYRYEERCNNIYLVF